MSKKGGMYLAKLLHINYKLKCKINDAKEKNIKSPEVSFQA
jgi:hypothetical protein